MTPPTRPHVLGIDDGPFDRFKDSHAVIVAVMTEGSDVVESVATTRFPLDGDGATDFLAGWIPSLRCAPALHAIVLGGITIAGLGVVDLTALAERLGLPVIAVNRRDRSAHELDSALTAAGHGDRVALVDRAPPPIEVDTGLFASASGADDETVRALLRACRSKSRLPEPLRLAHLIAAAVARGESHGRP